MTVDRATEGEHLVDLWLLKPGHTIRTYGGAEAEVLDETEDGAWIKVRYLTGPDDPSLDGTEDLLSVGQKPVGGGLFLGFCSVQRLSFGNCISEAEIHEGEETRRRPSERQRSQDAHKVGDHQTAHDPSLRYTAG